MNNRDRAKCPDLKLELLKHFILGSYNELDNIDKKSVEEAERASEIWCILFSTNSFDLYSEIVTTTGISPTANELNHLSDLMCAWYWLTTDDRWLPVFKGFLEKGLYPDSAAISACNPKNNTNACHGLTSNGKWLDLFLLLLNRNIYPTAEAASARRPGSNTNTWNRLALSLKGIIPFDLLLKKIIPVSEDLFLCDSDNLTHTWLQLVERYHGIDKNEGNARRLRLRGIFQTLLDKRVIPTPKDLTLSILLELATHDVAVIQSFLNAGIKLETHVNFAKVLLRLVKSNNGIALMQTLLDRSFKFSLKDLAECDKDGSNTWLLLTKNPAGIVVFQALLNNDMIPTSEDLAAINTARENAWWLLADETCLPVFLNLINMDIVPYNLTGRTKLESAYVPIIINKLNQCKSPDKDKIIERIESFEKIVSECNIPPHSDIAKWVTRDKKSNIDGFLYYFYLMTASNNITDRLLPEIWLLIGRLVMPSYVKAETYEQLIKQDNRSAFIKYHAVNSIDIYLNSSSAFFRNHSARAESLKKVIKAEEHPGYLLKAQFIMSRFPRFEYKKPAECYQRRYGERITNGKFDEILRDASLQPRNHT